METKDPALTKTPITDRDVKAVDTQTQTASVVNDKPGAAVNTRAAQTDSARVAGTKDDTTMNRDREYDKVRANTEVGKGTETFDNDVVDSEHVNDGDNPARQPDRRDQEGSSPFDGNINEETVGSTNPQSDEITDMNRYATIDNAQTRTLTPDEED